jgi:hypothetical protein
MRSINNVSNFSFVSSHHPLIKIENGDLRYFVFKCSDDAKSNFDYFGKLNNQFDELFYQQLFSSFKNSVELSYFHPIIMTETVLKIEMMDACKEFW